MQLCYTLTHTLVWFYPCQDVATSCHGSIMLPPRLLGCFDLITVGAETRGQFCFKPLTTKPLQQSLLSPIHLHVPFRTAVTLNHHYLSPESNHVPQRFLQEQKEKRKLYIFAKISVTKQAEMSFRLTFSTISFSLVCVYETLV